MAGSTIRGGRGGLEGTTRGANRGFTLIELMVVVAIIVLAAGVMTPTIADFFKNRQLESVKGQLGSAFNRARLKAVNEGSRTSLVFFREGVVVYDERTKQFLDEFFRNPESTPLGKGDVWFVLGFLDGRPSTTLPPYAKWKQAWDRLSAELNSKRSADRGPAVAPSLTGLPRITFERDGSLRFETGADISSVFFKEKPFPSNADVIIYQANGTTAGFVDFRLAGQIRSRIEPTGKVLPRPPFGDAEDERGGKSRRGSDK